MKVKKYQKGKVLNWLGKELFNLGDVVAKVKHPTWKRYYHGSPEAFDIQKFYKGTKGDIGLHMSDRWGVANHFTKNFGGGTSPTVYKIYAPRPTMEVMDMHSNGVNLFAGNHTFIHGNQYGRGIFDATPDTKLLFKSLRKYGGADVIDFVPGTKLDYNFGNLQTPFQLKRNVTIPMEQVHWPDRSPEVNAKIQELWRQYPHENHPEYDFSKYWAPKFDDEALKLRAKLNSQMADILAQNGHPVIKYANSVYGEGGGFSYILTDPTKMYLPPSIPIKNWHLGLGFGTGLGIGGGIWLNKKDQQ